MSEDALPDAVTNLGASLTHGLVKRENMANTTVLLTGATPDARPPAVARSGPMPRTADDPHYGVPPPQYQRRSDDYGGPVVAQTPHDYCGSDDPPNEVPPRPQYKPRYGEDDDGGPLLPFPFLFDRKVFPVSAWLTGRRASAFVVAIGGKADMPFCAAHVCF